MSREKYVYNPHTLQYEKHRFTAEEKFKRSIGFLSAVVTTAVILFVFAYKYYPTPKEQILSKENEQIKFHLATVHNKVDILSKQLEQLHEKDSDVHRMIFGIKPMDEDYWNGGIGGHNKYAYLDNLENSGEVLKSTLQKVDQLKLKMELQKLSFDSLYNIALSKEKKLASIPSIKPVKEDDLKKGVKFLSGFGMRIHPIHKIRRFHKGMDFTAPKGTDIQATGAGRVVSINKTGSGYGKHVLIDHGYGYKTLYAHMHTITVKEGEKVKKGQKIGLVGSTGASTAPHLHYEVWINGNAINPIDYVLDGLSPKEYRELVKKATQDNQSFD
ncbi:MAG: M23 family metallopeptidase [Saprospiraceae bacterium]|nr:M23 family metallopeptidase [Saprospiraceae bacterium]MBK6564527.1 M23 family metallopeptidase [Saprospiraceae bacterium]MBK7523163.1 M23 family metallopeptidase [Saprospiraceae bacterium]MBK8371842.1 M23 family metallopeptidase [Saprospiraceae bacterium]MBK8547107.1 M23 family metallopeptidase [Saprospiraceae bacterium]